MSPALMFHRCQKFLVSSLRALGPLNWVSLLRLLESAPSSVVMSSAFFSVFHNVGKSPSIFRHACPPQRLTLAGPPNPSQSYSLTPGCAAVGTKISDT